MKLYCGPRLLQYSNRGYKRQRPKAPRIHAWPWRPPYTLSQSVQFKCVKKNCTKNWTECSLAEHSLPIRFFSLFVSSVCLLLRVTMVDKNKAVVCRLLATSAIILSEKKKRKRKMWSKKWYLKRNIAIQCSSAEWIARNGCWRWVPWDGTTVMSAGKPRKLWDSLSELRSSLCERLERTVFEACVIASQNCAVYSFFPSGMTSQVKSLSLTESV